MQMPQRNKAARQPEPVPADDGILVIKRYPNRRLYDTSAGKYVNLNDVAAAVRQGTEVKVVDARTGEDLTRVVLTQIIVEDAKEQPAGLPLELLRQLIQTSDQAGRDFLMWYLKSAFDAYRKVQDTVQDRLSEVRTAALSPLNLMKNLLSGPPSPPGDYELSQLRERVAELEARLHKPKAAKRRKAPGQKRR
jgi:polyhydroxyalkanoate synthesis repressor PhaR